MKLFRIDNTRIELFRWLDPWNCLERVGMPGYFAVGATIEEDQYDVPAGLMFCFEIKNRIVIEWLCVDPDHRHERIGEELLLKAYEIAAYLEKEQVGVILDLSDEKKGFMEGAREYFAERLFEEEEQFRGIYDIKLSDIKKMPWFSVADQVVTKPLGSVGPKAYRTFIRTPQEELAGTLMCKSDISELDMSILDKDLSRVILDGDEISGILAVAATDNCLVPLALYSESEKETEALMRSFLQEATLSYDPDTAVILVTADKKVGDLLEIIAPGKTVPMDLLLADVSEYLAILEKES